MSNVFLVHEPSKWDGRRMVPIDMSPAYKFGSLVTIFPGPDRPPPIADGIETMEKVLADFTEHDFLVVAGDMDLVVWAAMIAKPKKLLKWDSRRRCYDVHRWPE